MTDGIQSLPVATGNDSQPYVREVRFPNQLTESVSYFTLPDSVNESTPVDDVQLTVDRIFAFDLLDR